MHELHTTASGVTNGLLSLGKPTTLWLVKFRFLARCCQAPGCRFLGVTSGHLLPLLALDFRGSFDFAPPHTSNDRVALLNIEQQHALEFIRGKNLKIDVVVDGSITHPDSPSIRARPHKFRRHGFTIHTGINNHLLVRVAIKKCGLHQRVPSARPPSSDLFVRIAIGKYALHKRNATCINRACQPRNLNGVIIPYANSA